MVKFSDDIIVKELYYTTYLDGVNQFKLDFDKFSDMNLVFIDFFKDEDPPWSDKVYFDVRNMSDIVGIGNLTEYVNLELMYVAKEIRIGYFLVEEGHTVNLDVKVKHQKADAKVIFHFVSNLFQINIVYSKTEQELYSYIPYNNKSNLPKIVITTDYSQVDVTFEKEYDLSKYVKK